MPGPWSTDVARGVGYGWVVWPAMAYSFGFPAPWILATTFLVGVVLLGYGIAAALRQDGQASFVLSKPQSAWFIAATAVFWVTISLVAPVGGSPGQSCIEAFTWTDAGSTNVTVDLHVPPGVDGVLARVGGFATGNTSLQAPAGTNAIHVVAVTDVTFHLERRVGGQWERVGGGGIENGSHQFGYDADFGAQDLRLVATAPGSRDGTTQQTEVRFLRQESAWTCAAT